MNPRLLPTWARALPVALVVALVVAGSARYGPPPVQRADAEAVTAVTSALDDEHHSLPVRPDPPTPALPDGGIGLLSIPSIHVNAVARAVGVARNGAMDTTPGIWDVGVFNQTVMPGEPGNALVEGHLDWYTGPAVFYHLHNVGMGESIVFTTRDGRVSRFAVSRSRTVAWNSAIPEDLYARSGPATITLITCSGTYLTSVHSYSTRLLLTATLVN